LIVAAEEEEKKYRKQQKKARKTLWVWSYDVTWRVTGRCISILPLMRMLESLLGHSVA
jgi:hypothetical protein